MRARTLGLSVAWVLGCAAEDPADSGAGTADESSAGEGTASTGPATATTGPTSSSADGTVSATDATTASSSAEASSGATSEASSEGTGGDCAVPPADFATVDGCPAPVGEPGCSEGQAHVPQDSVIEWLADPPHSGPHYPTWESWGEHDTVVPRGNWVHNLEHGGIVLAYRCNDDCPDELELLRTVVAMRPELRILLTPDPLLPGDRFAAISWTWVHRFDAPDLAELLCFVDQHENFAPEDVP